MYIYTTNLYIITKKNRILTYFQNKVKNLHKYNVIMTTGQFHVKSSNILGCWHPYLSDSTHPFTTHRKCRNDQCPKLQSSTLHCSKATKTLLVWLLQKVKFKMYLSICSLARGQVNGLTNRFAGGGGGGSGGRFISKWLI